MSSDFLVVFSSFFWKKLFQLNEIKFNFSFAFHPQIDGQTEVVNQTMEMFLRCFTSNKLKEWVVWLSWAKYCYNTSVHASTHRTPFEIVYGRVPPSLLTYAHDTTKVESIENFLLERDVFIREAQKNL